MTFLQLQNAVIDNTQRSDKLSVIKNAINFALLEIAKLHEWAALRTQADVALVAGDLAVQLATNYYKISEVRLINPSATSLSYPMHLHPKVEFVKKWPNVSAYGTGRPYVGYIEAGFFYFFPKSSDAFTLRYTYTKLPNTLSDDGDANPLVECDLPVIQWATSYLFQSVQMFEAAAPWMQMYAQSVIQSIRAEKRNPGIEMRMQSFSQSGDVVNSSPAPWLDPFAGHGNG